MNTLICMCLLACVGVAYASALPADPALQAVEGDAPQPQPAAEEESLEGQESAWGGYGGGWGRGYGGGWGRGYGHGWGRGYGGGWGHGYGHGWGRGYGGGYYGGWGR